VVYWADTFQGDPPKSPLKGGFFSRLHTQDPTWMSPHKSLWSRFFRLASWLARC